MNRKHFTLLLCLAGLVVGAARLAACPAERPHHEAANAGARYAY